NPMHQTSPLFQQNPVPPPPVLLSAKNASSISPSPFNSGGTRLSEPYFSVAEESKKACHNFFCMKRLSEADNHGYIFLFSCYPVHPVIQCGPTCGMVALAMASELVGDGCVTTEEILSEATKREFSKSGEMFSASAMQELASHFLPCQTECLRLQHTESPSWYHGRELIEQLANRNIALVPYDADRNHAPCQKLGHKAHWALLTGFFIAFRDPDVPEEFLRHCEREPDTPSIYYWPTNPDASLCNQLTDLVLENKADVLVLGRHGKCKYTGLWPLKDLVLSNANLVEVSPERTSDVYVIPYGGLDAGLRSQVVIIHSNIKS
ncbi:unnamed protein product, partial [Candidula unifasciata]